MTSYEYTEIGAFLEMMDKNEKRKAPSNGRTGGGERMNWKSFREGMISGVKMMTGK